MEYIRLCTVPVLQDSCVLSRAHDVDDSSLSWKEFRVANEVHVRSWGSRLRPIGPTSSVSPQSTTSTVYRGQGWENVPTKKRPSQGLPSAWNHKLPGVNNQPRGLAYIVVTSGSRSQIAKYKTQQIKNMVFWTKSPNLMPAKFFHYTVNVTYIALLPCRLSHRLSLLAVGKWEVPGIILRDWLSNRKDTLAHWVSEQHEEWRYQIRYDTYLAGRGVGWLSYTPSVEHIAGWMTSKMSSISCQFISCHAYVTLSTRPSLLSPYCKWQKDGQGLGMRLGLMYTFPVHMYCTTPKFSGRACPRFT